MCSLFDADESAHSRDQGASLDLHVHEGQRALRMAGLHEAFMAVARHEDQEQRVVDYATGLVIREELPPGGEGDRPEIDRSVLRSLLLAPLGDNGVQWNARVAEVVTRSDGRHELRLPDRVSEPYDLVIGADGAWSCVRAALTEAMPAYTGVTFVELRLGDVDRMHPSIAKLVGHGTLFSLHNGAGIIAQRNGNATIRVYAAFRTKPEDGTRPDKTLAGMSRAELLTRFDGWSPSLTSLIADADATVVVRPIVSLAPPLNWKHKQGLTLAGDAAHVMPPLGVGVNLAMLDAAELAEALVQGTCWKEAVRDFEVAMLERSNGIAEACLAGLDAMFSEGAEARLPGAGSVIEDLG